MKILIFIDHDIIIRHFIHSKVFETLSASHDVKFIFPDGDQKRVTTDVEALKLGGKHAFLAPKQPRLRQWKNLFVADTLRWRYGKQFSSLRTFRRAMIGPKATLLFSFLSLPGIYTIYKYITLNKINAIPNKELQELIDIENPDVIIHPSVLDGVFINDLVITCQNENIPLVVIMNSWDNPSTKKSVIGLPDWLLVWGEQTNIHAQKFMNMPSDRIVNFGAAQFDLFRHPPRISRDEFCIRHDLDPTSQILLYAGSSKETNEFEHLRSIDNAIDSGILGHTKVVYRPHPWGGGGEWR
ncbi:hypothetical protein [Magnetovibrio blakemorei]|uniref:Glycosyltransferase subfamily 4-like N-terminal domain-containing protein n=1 Tax=Magnetovibrio blakemorei TaxID=28181 RepID=A0A1E5Q5Y6_9PROT|nr:hypothetical protein [Magnetovibrio blakemorei]OEJ66078.1 hypothetical protein BEN30_13070 [Magnetovibrio blakemorei]OEJ66115.1 hypothetical protein BEN30_12980 [Magnetovibrio blakemorei]